MSDISNNIDKFLSQFDENIQLVLDEIGYIVENQAKENCGVDSGILRASIAHEVNSDSVTIGSGVEYAPYHHNNNPFLEDAIVQNLDVITDKLKGVIS